VGYINCAYEHQDDPERSKGIVSLAAQLVSEYPKLYEKLSMGLRMEFAVACAAIHKGISFMKLEPELRKNEDIFAFAFQECLAMEWTYPHATSRSISLRNPLSIFASDNSHTELHSKHLFETLIDIINDVVHSQALSTMFM
jgi:hypothetical protein